jgi:hypothetical protein
MSTLRIYIQQKVLLNNIGQSVIYVGLNPANLTQLTNTPLPASRQFPNYGSFIDVTDDCSDPNKLELTWTQDKDTYGQSTPGEFKAKKSASGTLSFEGDTYHLIKQWLIDDVSAPLNAIEVKIHDTGCDVWYNDYNFDNTDLMFCEGKICTFDVTLRQKDEAISCIKRTIISDNWQGWFQTVPNAGKKHPRFSYCNEQRPNGLLVCLWFLMGSIMAPIFIIMTLILGVFLIIANIINVIIGVIQFIISIVGGNDPGKVNWNVIPEPPLFGIADIFAMMFVESGGCGREHPDPLIRDYISNVCDKCGVKVSPSSAPIFFSQQLTIETSTRGLVTIDNPHYNDCYQNAVSAPGIRRVDNLNIFLGIQYNNSDYYVEENRPLLPLDLFLDEIKGAYNAEWEIRDNTLYFDRKDFTLTPDYVFDFSPGADDRSQILEGICSTWNEKDYPAAMKGLYQQDPADKPGNNAKAYYNDILSFANTDTNPLYEGILDKTVQIAPTKFRLDGASEDYIYDAMQVSLNSLFMNIAAIPLLFQAGQFFKRYADYGVLMQHETATLPKIITWDGVSYENAKAVRPYFAHGNAGGMPPINSNYNSQAWDAVHSPKTYVRGSSWTIPPSQAGYYLITDTFGIGEIKQPAMLCNYFMYLAPGFEGSLWDLFHWIDDPKKNPQLHQEWSVKIALCCENLQRLGMENGATNPKLRGRVKLPGQFYTDGRIKEITVHYETEGEFGQYIELRGTI